jgi:membrane fusion protein (multidrug efflux system)
MKPRDREFRTDRGTALRGVWLAAWLVAVACGGGEPPPPPPVEVVVAPVIQQDVPISTEWIGTTEGAIDAEIRAQVSGYLLSRDYREGSDVKKGDLLFRIDPRPYQAALDQAKGDLGRAQAALGKAQLDVARYTPLAAEGAVSQQELDNAVQARRAGEAAVQGASAAVEKAQLDLLFAEVRSPIDGIAGVARAQVGNLVGPSDPNPLTTVSQVDPIHVSVQISEREYLRFAGALKILDGPARPPTLELILADGSVYPHRGTTIVAGREIDPRTGTIEVKGEFTNPEQLVRPGQYARVRAVTETRKGALLVPQRALQETQGVFQVAVVGPDDKVALRVVVPGPTHENLRVIEKGLAAGERVVVEGIQKVRDGTLVAAKPAPAS